MLAVHITSGFGGILGGVVSAILLTWLTACANKDAKKLANKAVLMYGRPVRVLGWFCVLISLFILYAASGASADLLVLAWCLGTGFLVMGFSLFLEFHFVKILFDGEFIYTVSPWRPARKIPWTAISGYAFSDINKWHILKTTSYGNIRLSILLSGLGTFLQELDKRKIRNQPSR